MFSIFFESILNLIYPQVCGICGRVNKKSLCNKCKIKLKNEFSFTSDNYNEDINKNYIEHYYFFKYENLIRELILSLKFHEKSYVYTTISYFFKNNEKCFENLKKYDIIIVVPISKERAKKRGYNQSELIANEISKITNAKVIHNILYKTKNTVPQSSLNKIQRAENAKGVYKAINCCKINNKKILLIDDIYTTGSTINECAKAIVQNGIDRSQIGALTIAKD